ncbi:MAG: DUF6268 family outer membrane beta-barrel protein [Kiritimatiellae bacterium]|nr:DUF6268 family outer membrane beta-barrel protein [Kiritimatiellia bacterium]
MKTQNTKRAGFSIFLSVVMLVGLSSGVARAQATQPGGIAYYPSLDARPANEYYGGLTLLPDTTLEGSLGDTSRTDVDANWRYYSSDQFMMGTLDVDLVFGLITYGDDLGIDLPEQLLTLSAEFTSVWRYTGGYALQFGIRPGLYADMDALETDSIFVPFSGYFLKRVTPHVSAIAGAEVRPGFGLDVLPTLALDWEISDTMFLRLGIPETRFDLLLDRGFATYIRVEKESDSFGLDDDEAFARDTVTLEHVGAAVGLTKELRNDFSVGVELGGRFESEIEVLGPSDIEVDSAAYVRLSVQRPY